jgi:hypothetical protein
MPKSLPSTHFPVHYSQGILPFYAIHNVAPTNFTTQTVTNNKYITLSSFERRKNRKQKSSACSKCADGLVLAMSELQSLIPTCCFHQHSRKSVRVNVCWKIKYWRYKLRRVVGNLNIIRRNRSEINKTDDINISGTPSLRVLST